MASITTWLRLEPHCRNADLEYPLQMRVQDPLWLLGRQWQFGEFKGVDGGTPAKVTWSASQMPLTQLLLGTDEHAVPEEIKGNIPLEYAIEREEESAESRFVRNKLLSAQAGLRFFEILYDAFGKDYARDIGRSCVMTFPEGEGEADVRAFMRLMAGRAIDAAQLLARTEALDAASLEGLGFVDAAEHDKAREVINTWRDWCSKYVGPIGAASSVVSRGWSSARQEYSARLSTTRNNPGASTAVDLTANYRGGHLDWYCFDEATGPQSPVQSTETSQVLQPTKLSFHGRIGSKIWEFEDNQTNLDAISVPASDIVSLPFMEALLQYGNDFFRAALEVDNGSIYVSEKLVVRDSFGNETEIRPFKTADWRVFALSSPSEPGGVFQEVGLFVPMLAGQDIADVPIEQISLLRDEMANLAWGIESKVESKIGRPLDRHEAYHTARAGDTPPASHSGLVYELDSFGRLIPEYWVPMLAVGGLGRPLLECPANVAGRIRGLLLGETLVADEKGIRDEEIPRSGVRVQRVWQCARSSDGNVLVWIGREKRSTRGEGSSGLVYDTIRVQRQPDS